MREKAADFCGKQVARKGGWYHCACSTEVSAQLFRDGLKVSGCCWAFPKQYMVLTVKSLSRHLQEMRTPLWGTGYLAGASSVLTLSPSRGRMQEPYALLRVPLSRAPHQGAGRCWPLTLPLFGSYPLTEEFTLKNKIGVITTVKKGDVVFFRPDSVRFHFQACPICVRFSRCKADPWGQAVEVFYFSHHCTCRRTEFSITHIIWRGKPYYSCHF